MRVKELNLRQNHKTKIKIRALSINMGLLIKTVCLGCCFLYNNIIKKVHGEEGVCRTTDKEDTLIRDCILIMSSLKAK